MVPLSTSLPSSRAISPVKFSCTRRELDNHIVDRSELICCISHGALPLRGGVRRPTTLALDRPCVVTPSG